MTAFTLDSQLDAMLDRLYARSAAQSEQLASYFAGRAADGTLDWSTIDARTKDFLSDKLVALDRDKAQFCYELCRALRARRVVEAGTSFGVSTLFLAAAVRDNMRRDGGEGIVIGTEHEPEKATAARAHFAEAGLSDVIDLREGDLRETLRSVEAPVDLMLIDIWIPMAKPALALVAPRLRPGAVVLCDNTSTFREAYREYFEFIHDAASDFHTLTLPFEGGLEFTVRGDRRPQGSKTSRSG
jgi:predicted O-methyltransferase YrrM